MSEYQINHLTKCSSCGETKNTQMLFNNKYWEKGVRIKAAREILSHDGTEEQKEEALAKLFSPSMYTLKIYQKTVED